MALKDSTAAVATPYQVQRRRRPGILNCSLDGSGVRQGCCPC
jgi:hypothetical protein